MFFRKKAQSASPAVSMDTHPLDTQLEARLDEIVKQLHKSDKQQQGLALQLEDLSEQLLDGISTDETNWIESLIAMAQVVENMVRVPAVDEDMTQQATMMWRSVEKALAQVHLTLIEGVGETPAASTHRIQGTVEDQAVAKGQIAQILQAGYRYKGQVYQPASVMVSEG